MGYWQWGSIEPNLSVGGKLRRIGGTLLGRLLHVYGLTEKPIVIFASRRGGSTLLAQMIASQPGVDFSNEPLNLWHYHPYFNRLPHPHRSRFVHLTGKDEQKVLAYFEDLLEGRIRVFNEWNPLSPLYSFRVNRLVIKLLGANTLIDWFDQHFDVHIVYLLRHPVPVALSCLRQNWGNDAEAYLQNAYFRERVLGPDRARFAQEVLEKGTALQRFVLEWCLENFYSLQLYKERPWLVLTYEEIISRPKQISELLCSRLRLPDPERMARMVYRPSRTTFFAESRQAIAQQGPQALLGKWQERVSQEDLEGVHGILHKLGVSAYQAFSPYPGPELCYFGALGGESK